LIGPHHSWTGGAELNRENLVRALAAAAQHRSRDRLGRSAPSAAGGLANNARLASPASQIHPKGKFHLGSIPGAPVGIPTPASPGIAFVRLRELPGQVTYTDFPGRATITFYLEPTIGPSNEPTPEDRWGGRARPCTRCRGRKFSSHCPPNHDGKWGSEMGPNGFSGRATLYKVPAGRGCSCWCPRPDSDRRHRLRRPVLYPLSYGGGQVSILVARHCLPRHLDQRQYWQRHHLRPVTIGADDLRPLNCPGARRTATLSGHAQAPGTSACAPAAAHRRRW
jgi:hypothetical protein